jgi:hypothetical protein
MFQRIIYQACSLDQRRHSNNAGQRQLPYRGRGAKGPSKNSGAAGSDATSAAKGSEGQETPKPKRFHGSVTLEPTRVGRDAGRIGDEVIAHLVGLMGSDVKVTLEIEADIPNGAPDNVVRTVTENSRTLKFTSHGFEEE